MVIRARSDEDAEIVLREMLRWTKLAHPWVTVGVLSEIVDLAPRRVREAMAILMQTKRVVLRGPDDRRAGDLRWYAAIVPRGVAARTKRRHNEQA